MKVTFITRHFFSFIVPITIEAPSFDEAVKVFDSANEKIKLKFVPMFTFEGECTEHASIDHMAWQGSVPHKSLDTYLREWLWRDKYSIVEQHATELHRLERIRAGEVVKRKYWPLGKHSVVILNEQDILERLEASECELYTECDPHIFTKHVNRFFDFKTVIDVLVDDALVRCRNFRKYVLEKEGTRQGVRRSR